MNTAPKTSAERLKAAADTLRGRGLSGDDHTARMLELCEPLARFWAQSHAVSFMPLLEAALNLAHAVDTPPLAGYKLAAGGADDGYAWPTIDHLPCGGEVWGHTVDDADNIDLATLLRIVAAHRCAPPTADTAPAAAKPQQAAASLSPLTAQTVEDLRIGLALRGCSPQEREIVDRILRTVPRELAIDPAVAGEMMMHFARLLDGVTDAIRAADTAGVLDWESIGNIARNTIAVAGLELYTGRTEVRAADVVPGPS